MDIHNLTTTDCRDYRDWITMATSYVEFYYISKLLHPSEEIWTCDYIHFWLEQTHIRVTHSIALKFHPESVSTKKKKKKKNTMTSAWRNDTKFVQKCWEVNSADSSSSSTAALRCPLVCDSLTSEDPADGHPLLLRGQFV